MTKRSAALATALMTLCLCLGQSSMLCGDSPAAPRAVSERDTYNVGEEVRLKISFPSAQRGRPLDNLQVALRYAGEAAPLLGWESFGAHERISLGPRSTGYHDFWKVPSDARTGRYEIDLRVVDPKTEQVMQAFPSAGAFVVHRQLLQIRSLELSHLYYTSGDEIGCSIAVENLSDGPLNGLRVEFSERYWPWIVQQTARVGRNIKMLQSGIALQAHGQVNVASSECAEAKEVAQPAIQQFAAVVWDRDRKNVYDIAISPLVFVHPPGVEAPEPYPPQFMYPDLSAVNTRAYREFLPPALDSAAIVFDREHTMFPVGAEAAVHFTLRNPSEQPWNGVTVRASLRAPGSAGFGEKVVVENLDLAPRGSPLSEEVSFKLPAGPPAVFRVHVEVQARSGLTLAANDLEIAANPLPKSILIFCAHEDDEGGWFGQIRSAVENHIPIHLIYFTSGDAGSCDRYFQRSCGPEEALHFGAVRMQETRAALGHLGVPQENIKFLGLPDGGSGKIWYEHPNASEPYLSVLLASDHAPYAGLVRPNLPYARQPVVEMARELISEYQPQVVVAAHPPAEGHIDHIVNGYFVVKALQELARAGALPPALELRVDRVYEPKEQPKTPYHYEERSFAISGEAAARAQEAGWYYQSQGGNRMQGNLRSFSKLPRSQTYRIVLDWKEHEGWNEKDRFIGSSGH